MSNIYPTCEEIASRLDKIDYEGGFRGCLAQAGPSIIEGTPFAVHKDLLLEASALADETSEC